MANLIVGNTYMIRVKPHLNAMNQRFFNDILNEYGHSGRFVELGNDEISGEYALFNFGGNFNEYPFPLEFYDFTEGSRNESGEEERAGPGAGAGQGGRRRRRKQKKTRKNRKSRKNRKNRKSRRRH